MNIYCDGYLIAQVKDKKEKRKILGSLLAGESGCEIAPRTKMTGTFNFKIELGNSEAF